MRGTLVRLRRFLRRLETDVSFLNRHELIDYSLLVGISFEEETGMTERESAGRRGKKALVSRQGVREVYYVELIDYLIKYGTKKKLEASLRGGVVQLKPENRHLQYSALSVTEPTEYADRMVAFIRDKTPRVRQRAHSPMRARPGGPAAS